MKDYYKILGVSPQATEEEISKAFKALAKKHHPDVSKDPSADKKFKEINEAYSAIKSGKANPVVDFGRGGPFFDFGGPVFNYADFEERNHINPDLSLIVDIEFMEACLGSDKGVKYKIKDKCPECYSTKIDTGKFAYDVCSQCNGSGRSTRKIGPISITNPCILCSGTGKSISCKSCNGNKYIDKDKAISVKIPAGVDNKSVLKLNGVGNFSYKTMMAGDLLLSINVKKHPIFNRNGLDIYSNIDVDYATCITGGESRVETIHGDELVCILPYSETGSIVKKQGWGIQKKGDHYFTINVSIPKIIGKKERKYLNNIKKIRTI